MIFPFCLAATSYTWLGYVVLLCELGGRRVLGCGSGSSSVRWLLWLGAVARGGSAWLSGGSAALLARRQHLALTRSTSPGYYALTHHMVHISLFNSLFSLSLLGVSAQSRNPTSDTNVKVLGLNLLSLKLTRHTQMP